MRTTTKTNKITTSTTKTFKKNNKLNTHLNKT